MDVAAEVMKITGKGTYGIFVTAGSPAACKSAPDMVRVGRKVMCIGLRKVHVSCRLLWQGEEPTSLLFLPAGWQL